MIPSISLRDVCADPFALSPSEKMSRHTQTLERINKVLETLAPNECCIGTASYYERQAQVVALESFKQEIARIENSLKELAQLLPAEVAPVANTTQLTKDRITLLLQKHAQ